MSFLSKKKRFPLGQDSRALCRELCVMCTWEILLLYWVTQLTSSTAHKSIFILSTAMAVWAISVQALIDSLDGFTLSKLLQTVKTVEDCKNKCTL